MVKKVLNKECLFHLSLTVSALLFLLIDKENYDHNFELDKYIDRLIFIIVLISISIIRLSSLLSIYGVFFITSLIFICGRIFSYYLTGADPFNSPVSLYYYPSNDDKYLLIYHVCLSFLCMHLGFIINILLNLSNGTVVDSYIYVIKKFDELIIKLYFLVSIVYLLISFSNLIKAMTSGMGYLSLYSFQGDNYSTSYESIIKVFYNFLFGIVFIVANKKTRNIALGISLLIGFIYFFIGTRSSFIASILFILWYWHNYENKISIAKILMFGSFIIFCSQYLIFIGLRGNGATLGAINPMNLFSVFLYDQGVSLMVFELSYELTDVPLVLYFQSVIPGVNTILNLLGNTFGSELTSMGSYLAYSVNPDAYFRGNALGWTLFGDFNLFSFGHTGIFIILAVAWGVFLGYIDILQFKFSLVKAILISIFSSLVLSPRGGLGSVVPYMIYYIIFMVIFISLLVRLEKVYHD